MLENHPKIKNLALVLMGVSIGFKLGLSADIVYSNYHTIYEYVQSAIGRDHTDNIQKQLECIPELKNKIYLVSP